MSVPRAVLILIGLGAIAGAVVHLRARSTTLAFEIQQLHRRQIELKQEIWRQEMEIARLRSPQLMRARVEPGEGKPTSRTP
jgi:hypothetical protein